MTSYARAKRAAQLTIIGRFDRDFDDCFEEGDGDAVCAAFWVLYDNSANLRRAVEMNLSHFSTDGTIKGIVAYRELQLKNCPKFGSLFDAEIEAKSEEKFLTAKEKRLKKLVREVRDMME